MYEWDEAKSAATLRDRGFGFELMEGFLWDYAICVEIQEDRGEPREKWIGPIENQLYTVIITQRSETIRIITMWQSSQAERKLWRKEFEG